VFLLICTEKTVLNKILELQIEIASYTGGQGKYMKSVSFGWLSLMAALSISRRITSRQLIHSLTNVAILTPEKQGCARTNDWIVNDLIQEDSRT
jgi:hypothetical protein